MISLARLFSLMKREAVLSAAAALALLSMLCSALQGNLRGLAVAINAIAEKNGEGAEAAPAEAAAE